MENSPLYLRGSHQFSYTEASEIEWYWVSQQLLTVKGEFLTLNNYQMWITASVLTGLDLDCGGGEVGGGARGEGGVHRRGGAVAVVRVRRQHRRGQRPVRGQRLRTVSRY